MLQVHRKHLFSHRPAVQQTSTGPDRVLASAAHKDCKAGSQQQQQQQQQGMVAEPFAEQGGPAAHDVTNKQGGRGQTRSRKGPSERQVPAGSGVEATQGPEPGKELQSAARSAAAATHAASCEGAEGYDPIEARAWHPAFPLDQVTVEQCQAAAQQLASEKARQEVQDLGAPLPKVQSLSAHAVVAAEAKAPVWDGPHSPVQMHGQAMNAEPGEAEGTAWMYLCTQRPGTLRLWECGTEEGCAAAAGGVQEAPPLQGLHKDGGGGVSGAPAAAALVQWPGELPRSKL